MCMYVYIYHVWKKVGILATGCHRYGIMGLKRVKVAKNDLTLQKSTQNQRKNSPYQLG